MNYSIILYIIGKIMCVEGLLMFMPFIYAVTHRETSAGAFAVCAFSLVIIGVLISLKKPENRDINAREGFVAVGMSWVVMSVFGALPYVLSGQIPSFVDSFFETVSGFTTTGASILNDIEALENSILFWRSLTHWIGGMGILVFVLAVMPQADLKSSRFMHVMRAEVPGPTVGKMVAKIKYTAGILYAIYIALTLILVGLLLLGGMPLFDSFMHAFGTAATGGFGVKNTSIAYYDSAYIDYVLSIFMILFSFNFNIFYLIVIGQARRALKSEELWCFLGIVAISVAAITINISHLYGGIGESLRYALFHVTSIISTAGFSTTDFNIWPTFSKCILMVLMFIGACAGSTGGGIKLGRIMILVKTGLREIKYLLHPKSVATVKFEGKTVDSETVRGAMSYIIIYIMIFTVSILTVTAIENIDLLSCFTAVSTCLNNVGPGLEAVGPTNNFSFFSGIAKLLLSVDMLAGRLEIFPIILLFSPKTWKRQ